MSSIDIDITELRRAASDWGDARQQLMRKVRPVVSKGALQIKNAMRDDVERSRHFRFAHTISYDVRGNQTFAEAEIGPAAGGVAALAGFAYFGGIHGGGATVRDPGEALADEAEPFQRALSDVVAEVLGL